ncbi:MAG: hypothetical protein VW268_13040 [Rhodospirillaceae bacterium]
MPSLVEILQIDPSDEFIKQLEKDFNNRMNTPPCRHISYPNKIFEASAKGFCGSFATLVPPESLKTMACISNLIMSVEFVKMFGSASGGKLGSVRGSWTTAGEVSFDVAKLMLMDRYGRMLRGKTKKWMDDRNKATFVNSGGGMSALDSFERRNNGIKFLFLAFKGVSIYTGINNVARIMNGIPECGVKAPPGQKVAPALGAPG